MHRRLQTDRSLHTAVGPPRQVAAAVAAAALEVEPCIA